MILSAAYLGGKQSFWLTLAIIASTDIIIGNSNIFIFTWSGFLIPALLAGKLFSKYKLKGLKKTFQGTFLGVGSNFFFFIWTNFGVWLLDSWGMYPKTLNGLLLSYINALPFYKMQLVSTLIFVTCGFAATELLLSPYFKNINIASVSFIRRSSLKFRS